MLAGAFTNAHVTALAWVHLLLLDIVQARCIPCSLSPYNTSLASSLTIIQRWP